MFMQLINTTNDQNNKYERIFIIKADADLNLKSPKKSNCPESLMYSHSVTQRFSIR